MQFTASVLCTFSLLLCFPGTFQESSVVFSRNYDLGNALEMLVPVSNKIQNEQCRNHSRYYLQELRKLTLWATEMFDATAKFPSGVLVGSTYDFGNFDECIQVQVPLDGDSFSGKYCLATINIEPPSCSPRHGVCQRGLNANMPFNASAWDKIISLSQDRSKRERNILHWGFCIPSSCTEKDLQVHLQEIADIYNDLQDFKLKISVNKKYCQVHEPLKIDYGDIILVVCIMIIVITVLAATAYELLTQIEECRKWRFSSESLHQLAMSFSLINNIRKIFCNQKQEGKLDCIHGLKVYSMFLIIMGHRIMFLIGVPVVNTNYAEGFYNKIETMVLLNGPIIVDTFFSISGFLAAYIILQKRDEKSKNSNFIFLYIHRLIRLTPVYALILAFYCTLFVKLGNGPLWEERIGVEQERCIASWWANLLYLNNYVNTDKICMFQSWYITCDMHLFLITPLIIWLLRKNTKVGFIFLSSLIGLSVLSTFLTTYLGKLDAILLLYISILKDPTMDQTFKNIYIPTHTRASPYLVGIATGYLLHRIEKSEYKLPKKMVYMGWILCILTMEGIVYSAYIFYIPGRPYNPHTAAVYSAFHHFIWSICISWFILAICMGHGTLIEPLLSWAPLNSLSKIVYTAFLCHGGFQLYSAASLRTPMTCSVFNLIWYSLGDITMTFTAALFLTVFFESPVIGLEKILLRKGSNSNKERETWQKKVELRVDKKCANGNVTPISFIHVNSV